MVVIVLSPIARPIGSTMQSTADDGNTSYFPSPLRETCTNSLAHEGQLLKLCFYFKAHNHQRNGGVDPSTIEFERVENGC